MLLINLQAQAPEQARIAFSSDRDGNFELYTMDLDGGDLRRLTNNPAEDYRIAWSPDGQRIVFDSERDGNKEIYVIDADEKNPRNLTRNPAYDGSAYWFDPAWVGTTPVSRPVPEVNPSQMRSPRP